MTVFWPRQKPLGGGRPKGLPIGNLTSQLFANIYLHELDKLVKYKLRVSHYLRYTDDIVFVHSDSDYLKNLIGEIEKFLWRELRLSLHENKVTIRKFSQGVDFLGYVILPHYKLLRTKTKRRMLRKLFKKQDSMIKGELPLEKLKQSVQSYLGVLKHCRGHKLERILRDNSGVIKID